MQFNKPPCLSTCHIFELSAKSHSMLTLLQTQHLLGQVAQILPIYCFYQMGIIGLEVYIDIENVL